MLDAREEGRQKSYEILVSAGHRLTKARKHIITELARSKQPKSIQSIASSVAADEASVYRNIALFLSLGIIEEIHAMEGEHRYALAHGHHHHVVCAQCGYVEHLRCGEAQRRPPLPKHSQFRAIVRHEVTYFGTCLRCTAGVR